MQAVDRATVVRAKGILLEYCQSPGSRIQSFEAHMHCDQEMQVHGTLFHLPGSGLCLKLMPKVLAIEERMKAYLQ